jgi:pimeloyl-ACP methyl ester carboxylesterase
MNLLLLPGLLCDRAAWAPMLPHVQRIAECSVPDYANETSLGAMAERVLANAPLKFAVAGHSMGGRVGLEIVRRAPGRVERLALLDSGCHARPTGAAGDAERAGRLALLATAREHGMRTMAGTWVQPMVHPERLADTVLIDAILDMFARRTPQQFAGQIEALLDRPDATDVLRAATCPALVLCGREDSWATPPQHEEMAALMAGSQLTIIERCGHMAPMERPDAVGAALAAWLQAKPDASAPRKGERPDTARDMIA